MKLKYYLRGAGIGIIFTTIVMAVSSSVHKNNISDEYIIKEAQKLGMVMKESQDTGNGLFGNSQETEESEVTEESQDTENSQVTEEDTSLNTEGVSSELENDTPTESESEEIVYATVVVNGGDSAKQVADKVKEAGLVENAEEFRLYMRDHGYAYTLLVGSHEIPMGADYEEICKILTTRKR